MPIPIFKKLTDQITQDSIAGLDAQAATRIAQINATADTIQNSASAISSDLINVRQAATIAVTGEENTVLAGIDNGEASLSSTFARWARFRDAGSALTETTIPIGTIVSGIVITIGLVATTEKVRGRIWRRPLTSSSLNVAPGSAADDVLLIDTGIIAALPEVISMAGSAGLLMTVPVKKFEIQSGYTYGFDFQVYDSANNLLTATAKYLTTTAQAARHSGFYYASTASSSFSTQTATRPIRIGYTVSSSTTNIKQIKERAERKIAATANSSKLTDLERRAISRQGAWSGPDKIIRPNFPTHRMGLARLGLTDGTYGVDFGPRINPADMLQMADFPGVSTASAGQYRFSGATMNTPQGTVIEGYKQIADRGIYVPSANWSRLYMRDCYMDGQAVIGSPITIQNMASGSSTKIPYVEIEFCDFRRYGAGMGNIYNGVIRKSLILHSGANGVQIQQDFDNGSHLALEQNLICYVGTTDAGALPSSHSDVLEMNRARGLSAVGNVYYMPSSGTTYDPGAYGSTNCIRHSSENSNPISNLYHIGELVIGGNSPVMLHMRNSLTVSNILFAFNRYGGDEYVIYSNFIGLRGPDAAGITVDWCNLAFFDEYRTDGTPMPLGDTGGYTVYNGIPPSYYTRTANPYRLNEEKWGVFNWDKARATPKFIESLQLLGYATGRTILDSNNDLAAEYNLGALKPTL